MYTPYEVRRGTSPSRKGNWLYKNQNRTVYHETVPLDIHRFKSKNVASVSEAFALFNWSSVGYMRFTIWSKYILSIFNKSLRYLEVELKASIMSVWFSRERDFMKSLSKQKKICNKRSTISSHRNTNNLPIKFSTKSNKILSKRSTRASQPFWHDHKLWLLYTSEEKKAHSSLQAKYWAFSRTNVYLAWGRDS